MRRAHAARIAAAIGILLVTSSPAWAMHWIIYAPDEGGYRYWLDKDSIEKRGDITYAIYILGALDSTTPTTSSGSQIGINCGTGDSVRLDNTGNWIAGAHFTEESYLFRAVCHGLN